MTILFASRTTDGNSSPVSYTGGPRVLFVNGTFNGATIKLQASYDGTNFFDLKDAAWTSEVTTLITLPSGVQIRANQSNSGASTSLNVVI